MKRRTIFALAAATLIAVGVVAFLTLDDSVDQARTAVVAKRADAAASQAPRRDASVIPYSAAPTQSPSAAPSGAHKTAPPPAIAANAPVKSMLASLLAKARSNPPNAEAAMGAYELLTRCRRLVEDPPKVRDPTAPDCTGVTEADWKNSGELLKMAAEMGVERAQLTMAQRLLGGQAAEPFEIATDRDERSAAHERARQYLSALSERGNVDAMYFLSESLRLGQTSQPDLTMAYAYKYAIARAGGYPYTIDSELTQLESQLSPAEQAKGQDFANRLIQRCCTKR